MLHSGDLAPEFTLPDQSGTLVSLTELLASGPVVVFFYPAAMTRGCTAEACHFRDVGAEFAALGAHRIGISMDDVTKQSEFASSSGIDYPLLADVDGVVARAYGVKRSFDVLRTKRATFVIGVDGRVRDVIASEINMNVHADKALAALRA
jgi:peroxiredoxin Q/BCP